jgi:hypothetical protein
VLRESQLLPPFIRGQPSEGRQPKYERRAIGGKKKRRHQRTAGAAGLPAEKHQREGGRGISAEPSLLAGRCLSHAQTPLVIEV